MNDGTPTQPRQILSHVTWMSLPTSTRVKLAALFELTKTGESIVRYGDVTADGNPGATATQDGYKPEDLMTITTERMQEILGSKDDNFYALFGMVVANIDDLVEVTPTEEPAAKTEARDHADNEAIATKEEDFVPRNPEELLNKKPADTTTVVSEAVDIDNNLIENKTGKNAKPKTAKKSK